MAPRGLRAGQTLTLSGAGLLPEWFGVVDATLNIEGGEVGDGLETARSQVNITGGVVRGQLDAWSGSQVEISAGVVEAVRLESGSSARISGGQVGSISTNSSNMVTLEGAEFRFDGTPLGETAEVGDSLQFDGSDLGVLEGVLADGTPFVYEQFRLNDGVTFEIADLPAPADAAISLPADSTPLGVRNGETLVVGPGGGTGDRLRALSGSTVRVEGGQIGQDFAAIGAAVVVESGSIGEGFRPLIGTTVTISGGEVAGFTASDSTTVDVRGGTVGKIQVEDGSFATVAGGSVESLAADAGSHVTILDGQIADTFGGLRAWAGSQVDVHGGVIQASNTNSFSSNAGSVVNFYGGRVGQWMSVSSGSDVNLFGSDFKVNGSPVAGLVEEGDALEFTLAEGDLLTGVLSDGSVFLITTMLGDRINEQMTLTVAAPPDAQDETFNVPSDPAPAGLRDGQTLNVGAGGVIGHAFGVDWGGTVNLQGGEVLEDFEVVGAHVEITEGVIGERFRIVSSHVLMHEGSIGDGSGVYRGSEVYLLGGEIDSRFEIVDSTVIVDGASLKFIDVTAGGALIINDGVVDGTLCVYEGSTLEIAGGSINKSTTWDIDAKAGSLVRVSGGRIGRDFHAESGSMVHISGGDFDGLTAYDGSLVTVSGGAFEDFNANSASTIEVYGWGFAIDGAPIEGLILNSPIQVDLRDVDLTGFLADGTPLDFSLSTASGGDFFHASAVLSVTLVLPGDFNLDGQVDAADYPVWRDNLGAEDVALFAQGDANGDGRVTVADYEIWRASFGGADGDPGAVPEPNSAALALLTLTTAAALRRHRGRRGGAAP